MSAVIRQENEDVEALLARLQRLEATFESWEEDRRNAVEEYRDVIDRVNAEAFRRLISALRGDAASKAALTQAVADEVVYAVLRHHQLVKPSLHDRVEAALDTVRPMLAAHGGDVQVVRLAPPTLELMMIGACGGCTSSQLTLDAGIRKAIVEHCPEISEVIEVHSDRQKAARFASPFRQPGSGVWSPVCAVAEVPDDGIRPGSVNGQDVILTRSGAVILCFRDACAHLGLSMRRGKVEGGVITCPHHGFRYDAATGECLTVPELRLESVPVRLLGGQVEVRLES